MKLAALRIPLLLGFASAAFAAPVPAEQFFQKPAITGAELSPNGRLIAIRKLSPTGRSMLSIVDPETRTSKPIAKFRNADVEKFFWVSDKRLVFTVTNVDFDGDAGKPGVYAIDIDGKESVPLSETLVRRRSFAESGNSDNRYQSEMTLHGFFNPKKEEMLAIEVTSDGSALKRLSTRTGVRSDVRAPNGTFLWLQGPDDQTRLASTKRDNRIVVFLRDDSGWRQIDSFEDKPYAGYEPLLYVDGTMYARAFNGKDEAAIYRYEVGQAIGPPEQIISAPGFDVTGHFDVSATSMRGFRFTTDAENTVWFDPQMQAVQKEVDQLFPGMANTVSRSTRSETPYVLIDTHSDVQDHAYLLYNTETKNRILLGEARGDLDPAQMSRMSMVRYTARDGAQVPLFVTVPGLPEKKKLPTVVLAGPKLFQRNGLWQWNAEVQFLASRGYVVLQPEPRGVSGYGERHAKAGHQQWGRVIHDDVADAVKWAVQEGYTDPARVCIIGTEYGGYTAMMGLVNHPETYQCGISWSGVVDLETQIKLMGDPAKDMPDQRAASLMGNAARITRPVLLAYGKDDETVPYAQGRKLYDAIHAGNAGAEWLSYEPTVEDRKTARNRIDLWLKIEAFLGKHIGAATPGS
ncbi:alpha/beta hydrolase family protein [Duganella radicis]|uniref:Prolyl oligopeptidase family serine peptidase n=1 Tax=Duganella radicis TaxID=551988 RepID=A0A6L6PGF8_9BURK|nr:prolyl oligopeptidase family serine peptidase [Duganella radicis]MTV37667.1 prolyl oligopeptidase family serine peptidase [Duganella radicis]